MLSLALSSVENKNHSVNSLNIFRVNSEFPSKGKFKFILYNRIDFILLY